MDMNMSTYGIISLSKSYRYAADLLMEPISRHLADIEHGKNYLTNEWQEWVLLDAITTGASPILYLYRHSIELELKNIIHMAAPGEVKNVHSLGYILEQVKSDVIPHIDGWRRGGQQPVDWQQKWRELEDYLEGYFSNDEPNTLYRYPTKWERGTIDIPQDKGIKLTKLKESMDAVFNIRNEFREFIWVAQDMKG